mgnify:FL=1
MAYADYTFYSAVFYGSKIPENEYPYFAERATEYIDSLTFAASDDTQLSKACCACAEVMYSAQPDKQVTSEKVGDYSVSYAAAQTTVAEELIRIASRYLDIRSVRWV